MDYSWGASGGCFALPEVPAAARSTVIRWLGDHHRPPATDQLPLALSLLAAQLAALRRDRFLLINRPICRFSLEVDRRLPSLASSAPQLLAGTPHLRQNPMHPSTTTHHHAKAGLHPPKAGSHTFRHTFATRLLEQGQSLKTIADLLGHRHLNTTFIYTKVDLKMLHQLPLDWPEVDHEPN